MSIFKRKPASNTSQCEEVTSVQPINPFGRYAGSRCCDYSFPSELEQLGSTLSEQAAQRLSKITADEFNEDYFDSDIEYACQAAKNSLRSQRAAHESAAFAITSKKHNALSIYRDLLERFDRQIEENDRYIQGGTTT